MKDSFAPGCDRCRRLKRIDSSAGRLTADQTNVPVFNEMIKRPDRVGSAAHTGEYRVREPSLLFQDL